MCGNITLDPRISVDKPGATDVVSQLEYLMRHQFLKLRTFVL